MFHITTHVQKRLNQQNQNWLALIVGQPGSGKSLGALHLSENIDPNFSIDNVVFTPQAFMNQLNDEKVGQGSMVVFDEAGKGLPRREWYSLSNKLLSYVLQTFRHENIGVIFTAPAREYLDKQTWPLMHSFIETIGVNYNNKQMCAKVQEVNYDQKKEKTYYKYYTENNGKGPIQYKKTLFNLPTQELLEAYEKKQKQYKKQLSQKIGDQLNTLEEKQKTSKSPQEIAHELLNDKKALNKITHEYGGRTIFEKETIRTLYNCTRREAKVVKNLLQHEHPTSST